MSEDAARYEEDDDAYVVAALAAVREELLAEGKLPRLRIERIELVGQPEATRIRVVYRSRQPGSATYSSEYPLFVGRPARAFNQAMSVIERRTRGIVCLGFGLLIAVAFALRLV
jgi:hypothetical protein